ncbi:MAG: TraR/DksA family transcriptional regulator [Planctomycetaceae bacterium]
MLSNKDLDQFKDLLLDLRARLRGDVKQLSDGALDDGGESKSPTHMAELGTDAYERDFALSLMENDQETLEEISAALKRIDDGTYGLCEACVAEGKSATKSAIPKQRLKAIPHARNCVDCQGKLEGQFSFR